MRTIFLLARAVYRNVPPSIFHNLNQTVVKTKNDHLAARGKWGSFLVLFEICRFEQIKYAGQSAAIFWKVIEKLWQ